MKDHEGKDAQVRGLAEKLGGSEADHAFAALLAARAEEPGRAEFQAYFDAALDTLRKGAPGLAEPSRVAIARSIALKCQAARKALP